MIATIHGYEVTTDNKGLNKDGIWEPSKLFCKILKKLAKHRALIVELDDSPESDDVFEDLESEHGELWHLFTMQGEVVHHNHFLIADNRVKRFRS